MTLLNDAEVITFANGIKLYRADISPEQAQRYALTSPLLHEPTEEHWFNHVFDEIQRSSPSNYRPTFLDIGSALGYYCLLFARKFPDANLVAVDPSVTFQERMAKTFELNELSRDDYEQIPFAIYPHGSKVVFAERSFGSYIAQGESIDSKKIPNSITIDVIRLKDVLAGISGPVDLVKMDIQGAEQAVFNKNIDVIDSGKVKYWAIGTHGPNIHKSILTHLSRRHDIWFEEQAPQDQVDGLIIASLKN